MAHVYTTDHNTLARCHETWPPVMLLRLLKRKATAAAGQHLRHVPAIVLVPPAAALAAPAAALASAAAPAS
jgi:hypothetical protein